VATLIGEMGTVRQNPTTSWKLTWRAKMNAFLTVKYRTRFST